MRTMYDGIDSDAAAIAKIAGPGDVVAYYIDGKYAWTPAQVALLPPGVAHVSITVQGGDAKADVADCETGDLTPDQAAEWVRNRRADGYERPTVYHSLSGVAAVRQATGALVLGRQYDIWIADYDGLTADPYPLAIAKQYRTTSSFDVSAVYDDQWPHWSPGVPTPAVAPAPVWPASAVLREGGRGGAVRVLQEALNGTGLRGVRNIGVDGDFGTQTETAVRNFQEAMHLAVDGVAGKLTRAALGVH